MTGNIASRQEAGACRPRHPASLRLLHWLAAVLIVMQVGIAWAIPDGDTGQSPLWAWHATLGPLILLAMLIRLGLRWARPTPELPADLPGWQRQAARLTQWGLYLVVIAMTLTGWAIFSVHGNGPLMFGSIQLPPIVPPAPAGADVEAAAWPYAVAHVWLGNLLIGLFVLHVAGALQHRFLRRDGVFESMASVSR